MTAANAILYALLLSIWLIVLSLGARASVDDALYVIRRPVLLIRAMAAIFVVMPAFALTVSSIFSLPPEIEFALVALSVSPIPPLAPRMSTFSLALTFAARWSDW